METLASQSIPVLPIFFSMFLIIYLIGYWFVFRNWTAKIRQEGASCFTSLFHGTPAVFLATYALFSDSNRGFASINTDFQNLVLDYSIAYFFMDLLHYLIFFPSDVLFIGHHLATLFVFATCRYVVFHGSYAILVLLVLAEVTSACQNVWTIANSLKSESPKAAKVYDFLSPPFYALYTVVRGFVGPFFVYQMVLFYASGVADNVIPRWMWVSWIVVVVMALCLSILWISNLWVEFFKERNCKLEEKKVR